VNEGAIRVPNEQSAVRSECQVSDPLRDGGEGGIEAQQHAWQSKGSMNLRGACQSAGN
jgi:hypothetical protein